MDKKITAKEAAEILGVSTRTLRRKNVNGELIAHRDQGNHPYYFLSEIDKYLSKDKQYKIIWNSSTHRYHNEIDSGLTLLTLERKNIDLSQDPSFKKIIELVLNRSLKELIIADESVVGTKDECSLLSCIFRAMNVNVNVL